ncbi:ROK family transcriptional regulator, partial [Streptomyces sp. T-3]|nr:ROK family transcriptional regulator [Streptomyces sp. T-3]
EIGFLPVPGTVGLPSATGCEGGFHSLVGSHAIGELAAEHGLVVAGRAGESAAATVVREAVEAVAAVEVIEADSGEETEAKSQAAFLDALADRLALGAASVAAVLDPGCVVLGGEVGRAGGAPLA